MRILGITKGIGDPAKRSWDEAARLLESALPPIVPHQAVRSLPTRRSESRLDDSVTEWIDHLRAGDRRAGDLLSLRFHEQLAHAARQRFSTVFTVAADENDLVQSVFRVIWKAASRGSLRPVADRDSFWCLLLTIARNKAISRVRAARATKRGGRVDTVQFSQIDNPGGIDGSADPRALPADDVCQLLEEQQRLFAILKDDSERAIATFKLEGLSHPEIASRMRVSVRTVERKVAIIRETWLKNQSLEEGLAEDDPQGD